MRRPALEVPVLNLELDRDEDPRTFYIETLTALSRSTIPFLVGGAHGLARYLGVDRQTKDLDVFICPDDVHPALNFFRRLGYDVDLPFPHWLGKVSRGATFVDLIFSSGNGIARVDADWFAHARRDEVLGVAVKLCPPEEMIWSKAFVQERERFDGADVLHLFRHFGGALDWQRLLQRFGPHWRVLFGHIVSFGFVYPDQRHRVPVWVVEELSNRFARERSNDASRVCNGTLLSREQYLHDVCVEGYQDARVAPTGHMTPEELEIWTAAIGDEK